MTGSGTEAGVAKVCAQDVREFRSRWHVPGAAQLIAVGPLSAAKLTDLAQRAFERFQFCGLSSAHRHEFSAGECGRSRVLLLDAPGRSQSAIFAALTTTPRNSATAEALIVANTVLGGSFASRLNMNLREAKGWSYGAHSMLLNARGPGLWLVYTSVRPSLTAAAMSEITREMRRLVAQPVADLELSRATTYLTLRMPAEFETNAQVAAAVEDRLVYQLPQSYYRDLPARLRSLRAGEIADACQTVIGERSLSWLVVGDAATIASGIEAEAFGDLKVIDCP